MDVSIVVVNVRSGDKVGEGQEEAMVWCWERRSGGGSGRIGVGRRGVRVLVCDDNEGAAAVRLVCKRGVCGVTFVVQKRGLRRHVCYAQEGAGASRLLCTREVRGVASVTNKRVVGRHVCDV